ncbi:hypothetical protein [Vulcanococcus limneticus]|uniref:hypothetical protein n=1 Tax=Vulcanococcus limneticus TaxID=2170428 RepID=UPI00398BF7C2
MSQLTITLSDKADALIAQLQKEIFNRRRKKVSAAGVVETLVESGAKSQSDKRFATSWRNLIADIEKAAKVADAHGSKPANLTDAEWALVLSHRTRATSGAGKGTATKSAAKSTARSVAKSSARSTAKSSPTSAATTTKPAAKRTKPAAKSVSKTATKEPAKAPARKAKASTSPARASTTASSRSRTAGKAKPTATSEPSAAVKANPAAKAPASRSRKASPGQAKGATSSVAKRMAKAVSRLGSTGGASTPAANDAPGSSGNGAGELASLS